MTGVFTTCHICRRQLGLTENRFSRVDVPFGFVCKECYDMYPSVPFSPEKITMSREFLSAIVDALSTHASLKDNKDAQFIAAVLKEKLL